MKDKARNGLFYKESLGRRAFVVFLYVLLSVTTFISIFPILNVLAVSFSSKAAVNSGEVTIWPIGFQLSTYGFVIGEPDFYNAFFLSVLRTALAIVISTLMTVLAAYPLSQSKNRFKGRGFYVAYFMVPMLFSGGLIPSFLVVYYTGLIDTVWALVIPCAVPIFNIILLQNFFKELPFEISESAFIDGASHWTVLTRILLPLSKPVMATLILFVAVSHWNAWFDAMIYMNSPKNYPLQTYLQTIVVDIDTARLSDAKIQQLANITPKNSKAAQIVIAMIPILCVYPFLQKHFTKGIILGSVKG